MARRATALARILSPLAGLGACFGLGACGDGSGPPRTSSDVAGPPPARETPCVVPDTAEGPAGRTHVVRPGETLRSIALREYGDERFWTEIARANPACLERGGAFRAGTVLTLPDHVR